jgi:hypothetical protein
MTSNAFNGIELGVLPNTVCITIKLDFFRSSQMTLLMMTDKTMNCRILWLALNLSVLLEKL